MANDYTLVQFTYRNHRSETALRTARPIRIWFGSTAFHADAQWLLEAWDLGRRATRDFALANIEGGWQQVKPAALEGLT